MPRRQFETESLKRCCFVFQHCLFFFGTSGLKMQHIRNKHKANVVMETQFYNTVVMVEDTDTHS